MNAPLIVLARRDARCLSLLRLLPFSAIKKYAGRNNDCFIRNSAILADARRRADSTDPPLSHARRTLAHSYIRSLARTHASASRPRARVSNALRGARADDDEAVSLPRGFPSHASSPPARLSLRSFPRTPHPAGTVAAPRAHRFGEPNGGTV